MSDTDRAQEAWQKLLKQAKYFVDNATDDNRNHPKIIIFGFNELQTAVENYHYWRKMEMEADED